ncbi:uncharacterized protein [Procambarus clarkii]|uniref:uncharacterized protein n=1 Tax=Procambarus clarkii TaxID=6728 RepID=UPI003743C333
MASLKTYIRPVLVLMSALEATMVSVAGLVWYQTKMSVQDLYAGMNSHVAHVRRRASDAYEDIQVKAGDTYQVFHGRTSEACQQWLNRANLVYIECQLRLSLALHRCQFRLSLLCQDLKVQMMQMFRVHVGLLLHVARRKAVLMHRWTKIKITKWKRAAAKAAKVNLQRMSLRAREYEDVLEEKLHRLSRSPSTQSLEPKDVLQPLPPPRTRARGCGSFSSSNSSSSTGGISSSSSSSRQCL